MSSEDMRPAAEDSAERSSRVYAFIGLGNPGAAYERTRHNIGFRVIDAWLRRLKLRLVPVCSVFHAVEAAIEGQAVVLVKPMTFMNRSGRAVVEVCRRYDVSLDDLVISCDDVHLPFGTLRLRGRGSDGGHNGLASIIHALRSETFARQRIGVDAPPPGTDRIDYVLGDFTSREEQALDTVIERACMQLQTFVLDGLEVAASRYNGPCPI